MPTLPKDGPRARRRAVFRRAEELGLSLDSERQLYGANSRGLATAAKKAINDAVPAARPDAFVIDAPPAGAFDGSNKTFTLSAAVDGLQIAVVFTDVSAQTGDPLERTDQNPPPSGKFYFDINNPTTIITGDAPEVNDMLVAVFKKA